MVVTGYFWVDCAGKVGDEGSAEEWVDGREEGRRGGGMGWRSEKKEIKIAKKKS